MSEFHIFTWSGPGEAKQIACTPPSLYKYKVGDKAAQVGSSEDRKNKLGLKIEATT